MKHKYLKILEKIRESRNLNRGQMAEMMGITPSAYSGYFSEKEKQTEPSFSTICNLAEKITPFETYELLTGLTPDTIPWIPKTEVEKKMCITFAALTPTQQINFLSLIASLLSHRK